MPIDVCRAWVSVVLGFGADMKPILGFGQLENEFKWVPKHFVRYR